jgi:hypothetical protein
MELTITFTEGVLFAWAILATAAALKYKQEKEGAGMFIEMILRNRGAYDKMVELREKVQAQ